jgi:hypothetical protein
LAAALLAAAAVAAACAGSDNAGGQSTAPPAGTPGPSETPSTPPEEALRRYVQNRLNQSFVADCDEAQRPGDVGKQCARLAGERNGMLAYELGPTFAEYTRMLIIKPEGNDWTLVRLEVRDPTLPPVPGIPWPLEVGARVVVVGAAPDCLRIREQPGTAATQVGCLDDGTAVTVVAGPVERDDIEWWQIEGQGWAAGAYLRYPEEAPTPTPEE